MEGGGGGKEGFVSDQLETKDEVGGIEEDENEVGR